MAKLVNTSARRRGLGGRVGVLDKAQGGRWPWPRWSDGGGSARWIWRRGKGEGWGASGAEQASGRRGGRGVGELAALSSSQRRRRGGRVGARPGARSEEQ